MQRIPKIHSKNVGWVTFTNKTTKAFLGIQIKSGYRISICLNFFSRYCRYLKSDMYTGEKYLSLGSFSIFLPYLTATHLMQYAHIWRDYHVVTGMHAR